MNQMFTPEELAELAAFDAEIDDEPITQEEIEASRQRDKDAAFAAKDTKAKKVAASKRAYREANKEKVAAYQRAYYEANKEKVAAYQRAYREANKEKCQADMREYMRKKRAMQKEAVAGL